jgi:hypothetical protein
MWNPRHGVVSGKARRVRALSRASRLQSRELISEYFDWHETSMEPDDHPIRLGRRSEFFPSVTSPSEEQAAAVASTSAGSAAFSGVQLELPLTPADVAAGAAGATHPDPAVRFQDVRPIRPPRANGHDWRSRNTPAMDAATLDWRRPARPKQPLSLGGFLYGCVLGGAAAAVVLLVVHLATG